MRETLFIGLAVVTVGFSAGWLLRGRRPFVAHACHFGAAALVRILAAVALGWGVARLLKDHDAFHIAGAVILCLLGLWSLLLGALMSYVLVMGPEQAGRSVDGAA
jgi:putative Mn2+ efflux pump MntP